MTMTKKERHYRRNALRADVYARDVMDIYTLASKAKFCFGCNTHIPNALDPVHVVMSDPGKSPIFAWFHTQACWEKGQKQYAIRDGERISPQEWEDLRSVERVLRL